MCVSLLGCYGIHVQMFKWRILRVKPGDIACHYFCLSASLCVCHSVYVSCRYMQRSIILISVSPSSYVQLSSSVAIGFVCVCNILSILKRDKCTWRFVRFTVNAASVSPETREALAQATISLRWSACTFINTCLPRFF